MVLGGQKYRKVKSGKQEQGLLASWNSGALIFFERFDNQFFQVLCGVFNAELVHKVFGGSETPGSKPANGLEAECFLQTGSPVLIINFSLPTL